MNREDFLNLVVGDKIYKVTEYGVIEKEVAIVNDNSWGSRIIFTDGTRMAGIGSTPSKNYYQNKEEAEKEIEKRKNLKIKKAKLFEYERQLNEELGIDTFIIKY